MSHGLSPCVILTVEEALKIIKKLTAANEKQEATIASLTKVCEKVQQHQELSEVNCRGVCFHIADCGSAEMLFTPSVTFSGSITANKCLWYPKNYKTEIKLSVFNQIIVVIVCCFLRSWRRSVTS